MNRFFLYRVRNLIINMRGGKSVINFFFFFVRLVVLICFLVLGNVKMKGDRGWREVWVLRLLEII